LPVSWTRKDHASCQLYAYHSGHFIRKSDGRGSFQKVFAALLRGGTEFRPPYRRPDVERKAGPACRYCQCGEIGRIDTDLFLSAFMPCAFWRCLALRFYKRPEWTVAWHRRTGIWFPELLPPEAVVAVWKGNEGGNKCLTDPA
jgi:hypothetical protein